jgi:hypothetical protein
MRRFLLLIDMVENSGLLVTLNVSKKSDTCQKIKWVPKCHQKLTHVKKIFLGDTCQKIKWVPKCHLKVTRVKKIFHNILHIWKVWDVPGIWS